MKSWVDVGARLKDSGVETLEGRSEDIAKRDS